MMKRLFLLMILGVTSVLCLNAQTKSLHQLQQEFVDLRCGMFIHFNMPTFLMRTGRTRMLLPSFQPCQDGLQTMGKSGKISQHDLRMSDNETS